MEQEPLDANFLPGSYDAFSFSNLPTAQGSPDTAAAGTPMPIGSVDSGIGADMEDSRASRTRSSSEEKEANMTPAQSRRKAQNRAAYVEPFSLVPSKMNRM
jgi:AP-1-like factor